MKYIVLKAPGREVPILFPRDWMHSYVAGLFAPMEVVAAGFVRLAEDGVECYGVSIGLKIASRPLIDSELVGRELAFCDPRNAPPATSGQI